MIATSQFTISVINDGAPGSTGPQGVSVTKVVEEYRLSDSSTELTGSGTGYTWSETKPDIPSGKYLWIRERTDLSNNTSAYGTAHCDIVISGLVFDVNRNSGAITSKIWESDITSSINEYDGSTGKAIRDRVTQTENDISGINTTVGNVQTTLNTKADGSTVTALQNDYSSFKQTMNGFKTTVESSYATIEDLNGVKVSGNNLYHIKNEVPGYLNASSGEIINPSSKYKEKTSAYIPVIPNVTYIIQSWATPTQSDSSWLGYQFFTDETASGKIGNRVSKYGSDSGSGVEITAEGQERLTYKVTAPENAKYLRVSYRHFEDGCCMVEQATIPSEYAIAPVDIEHDTDTKVSQVRTIAEQTADKFTWLVQDGTSASNFTLTSRVAELISPQVVIKDPAGSATIITGGKIQANSITTNMLKSDAIKSTNYTASSNASSPYSATGAFLDLNTGSLYMPNFGVNGTTGAAYFNGTVNANAGKFGDDTSYWNIETVYDYNMQPHAALVGTGSPYLQTGNWQVSDNAVATRKYTSTDESTGNATYYKDSTSNTFYDVGMKIPTNFGGYSASDSSVTRYNKAFYYGRKYTGNNIPSLDSDWTYFFEIDSGGNIITAGDVYEGGVKLSEKYAAITDVGSAYLPKTGGTITGNLTVNGSFTTNLQLQTNLGSTSSAQLTGAANAVVKPGVTGTLGVANGGTGVNTFMSGAALIGNGSGAIQTRAIKNNLGNSALGWVSNDASTELVNVNTIAYWNGAYRGTTSNLEYVKLGKLGTVVTHDIEDFITSDGGIVDGSLQVTDLQVGNLMVTGAGRFTNGLYGDLIGNADTATTADKVGSNLVILLNSGTTEGTNKFTYNGSAAKNINITKSSIGLGSVENTALSTWAGSANLTTTKVGTLAAAAAKGVDTSISAGSTSTNLPTSKAVAAFVEGKGYVTSSGVTSITLKAGTGISLDTDNTAITSTGSRTISLANTYGDTKNPYGTKTKNYVLAGPTSGDAATPSFRALVADDIPTLASSKVGLGNVTNNKQVKGLSSGTTSGHLVTWGADGYTVADSGVAIGNVTTKITLAGSDYSTSSNTITITQANLQSAVQSTGLVLMTSAERSKLSSIQVSEGGTIDFSGVTASSPLTATVGTNKTVNITHNTSGVTAGTYRSVTVNTYGHVTAGTNPTTLSGYGITDAKIASGVITLGGNTITPLTASSTLDATKLSGTASISTTGNAGTATKFESNQSVTLTGDTTGTASSQAGWSIATTTKKLTNSGRLTSANVDNSNATYSNKITYFLASSSMTEGKPPSEGGILNFAWSDNKWGAQLAIRIDTTPHLHLRGNNNTSWDSSWLTVLDSNNYNAYAPKKDGTGATGTWGISISGNATSATSATKATQDSDGNAINTTYLKRSGGTMTGQLKTNGTDIVLGATGTGNSPNDSGDLVWQYGNGTEKMRLWSSDSYTVKHGPLFRVYNENNELLYTGNLPLADGTDATGTWGISITGSATKATQDSDGNAINTTYMKKSGGTFTGEVISQTGGIWVQGNSAAGGNYNRLTLTSGMPTELKYNGGKRGTRIYSNAIAFADPYNGNSNNDAGWIRHIEETANVGTLEIATGDDANELIKVRQYNTSSAIAHEMTLLDSSGNTAVSGKLTIGSSTSAAANTCQLVMNTSTHSLDFVFN